MYRIAIYNDDVETLIHAPYVSELKLLSGQIKSEINKIDSFNFSVSLDNPGYGKIKPLKTVVKVFNTKTGMYDFEGRVLEPSVNMDESGMVESSYVCEGELGYLHDSMQRHLEYTGSVVDLFTAIITYHNSQVESYKRFFVGDVTVTDPNDYLYLYLSAESDTLDTIKTKLIDRLGGELRIRNENGKRYLDYLTAIGEHKATEIRLSKNLLTSTVDIDPTEIITRLTPLGTRVESDNPNAVDASEARLTIESVNAGKPYLDRPDLISIFGIQGGSVVWDEVTLPGNLKSKGQEYLNNQKITHNQYSISALDLSLIGMDIDSFEVGNWYPTINPVMSLNEPLRLIGKTTDINAPQKSSLSIGDKFKTRSEYQSEVNKSAERVSELQNRLAAQGRQLGDITSQLAEAKLTVNQIQTDLQDVDIENLPAELQSISLQLSGLQSTLSDIEQAIDSVPVYGPANSTIDGLLTAELYMKLQSIQLATESIDGLLTKEDKQKLNKITVNQSIDLDQFMADFLALKDQVENI